MGPWPFPHGKPGRFVCGDERGERFLVGYYRDAADADTLHAKFCPSGRGFALAPQRVLNVLR